MASKERLMKEPVGRVYVLTNPRMHGVVKIGFTLGTVEGRAKELDSTGTPEPFEIAYQVEVRGPEKLERHAHMQLTAKRVRNSREFFEVDVAEAIICIRNLAIEKLDEEFHRKYIDIVDETAKRRAAELEMKRASEKAERFERFDREAKNLQDKKNKVKRELDELLVSASSAPQVLQLNLLEARGISALLFLGIVFLILCFATLSTDLLLSGISAILAIASFITSRWAKSNAKKKYAHNLPIEKRQREINNLRFDLEHLEGQKVYLPSHLSEFLTVNPVHVDERGFEPAAKFDSRRLSKIGSFEKSVAANDKLAAVQSVIAGAELFAYELANGLVPDGCSDSNPGLGPMDFDEWQEWKQREFDLTGNLWHNQPSGRPPG
jgi:hypothetical protein